MTTVRRFGLLGGTFDPIHHGHLDIAAAARDHFALDRIGFIPAHDPPHRTTEPRASAYHRFALVTMAIDGCDGYVALDLELRRPGPSYTVDTLRALHAEGWRPSQLFFIIGTDAFAEIAKWRSFPAVLDAAHFVVLTRPGTSLDAAIARTPELQPRIRRRPPSDAEASTAVILMEAQTRDISSTVVRTRLRAGQPVDDLLPAAVSRHIAKHNLYGTVDQLHG